MVPTNPKRSPVTVWTSAIATLALATMGSTSFGCGQSPPLAEPMHGVVQLTVLNSDGDPLSDKQIEMGGREERTCPSEPPPLPWKSAVVPIFGNALVEGDVVDYPVSIYGRHTVDFGHDEQIVRCLFFAVLPLEESGRNWDPDTVVVVSDIELALRAIGPYDEIEVTVHM